MASAGYNHDFLDALSDDIIWTATGSSPLAGRYEGKKEYSERILIPLRDRLATPVKPIIDMILADGEWGIVQFHSEGVSGRNGADFSMQYCWIMKVVDQKITEVIGYYDSAKMRDLFS